MGFHSDQALDLEDNSYIAIYSCYENTQNIKPRKLIIKNKITNELSEINMDHNSVILFDLETNKKHLHKIIADASDENNKWLGITFRLSKTYIQYIDNIPFFYNTNHVLKLANDEEMKRFYKMRSDENKSINYQYPEIHFTVSSSDILNQK